MNQISNSVYVGTIIKSNKVMSDNYGEYGVVVGIYGSRLAYESDFCAIFPKRKVGNKYTRYTFNRGEYEVVTEVSTDSPQGLLRAFELQQKVLSLPERAFNKKEDYSMGQVKFLVLNIDRDINHQLGMSKNVCETKEQAIERCKEFILKYPSASFHIFEAVAVVKPKSEVDIIDLKPALTAGQSGTTPT